MSRIDIDNSFWKDDSDEKSFVFQYFPDVYGDSRGSFSEVLKYQGSWSQTSNMPLWFSNIDWIRQINRSKSVGGVVRGCHAQSGIFCQGKLVEAINNIIFDVITDARPYSDTFGSSGVYVLDPTIQNKLWVPRGFLHGFVVPELNDEIAIFNYYVDNAFNKNSEIHVNPMTIMPTIAKNIGEMTHSNKYLEEFSKMFDNVEKLTVANADLKGENYEDFMRRVLQDYNNTGKSWCK